jgi:hypothetical protein
MKKKKSEEQGQLELTEEETAAELEQSIEDIEAEKERKRFEREEKKFLKEHKKKRQKQERFIAPLLLILTLLISYLIYLTTR